MDKKYLTAPCGADCFNCLSYEKNITEEFRKKVSEYLNIPIEHLPCKGCREEKGFCKIKYNQQCVTWSCAQEKGVNYCYECNDFPCVKLLPSQKGAQLLHNVKLYNLCRIKHIGIEKWFKEVEEIRKRYFDGKFIIGEGSILEE